MKNKKLFAILTLVCFMFTLMPVAAFAAEEVVLEDGQVYVNNLEEAEVTAGVEFTASVTTSGVVYFVVEDTKDEAGVAVSKDGKFTIKDAGDYKVYALATNDAINTFIDSVASPEKKVADLKAAFEDEIDAFDCAKVTVVNPELDYRIRFEGVVAGEVADNAITIEANNGFKADDTDNVVAVLEKAPKGTPANSDAWSGVKNQTLTLTTVGYVNAAFVEDALTDKNGKAEFEVTSGTAGEYKVIAKWGKVKQTLTVNVNTGDVAKVTVNNEPEAPVNVDNAVNESGIEFKFTDATGAAVEVTGTDYEIIVVEKPADSKLKGTELKLTDDPEKDGVYDLDTVAVDATFKKVGTYKIKVALENGNSATATVEVAEQGDVVAIKFVDAPKTIAYNATALVPFVGVDNIVTVDADGVTGSADSVTFSVVGKAVKQFTEEGSVALDGDDKYIGTKVVVYAVYKDAGEVYTASTEVVVADVAANIVYKSTAAEVGVTTALYADVVDSEGNKVVLPTEETVRVEYVVLDKPENAVAVVTGEYIAYDKNLVKTNLLASQAGEYKIQTIVVYNDNTDETGAERYLTSVDTFTVGAGSTYNDIVVMSIGATKFVVNNEVKEIPTAPVIENGRTMVPLRALVEAFGADVVWDDATRSVTVTLDNTVVVMTVDAKAYTVNGVEKTADVAPFINADNYTMVPVRFVAQAFGITPTPIANETGAVVDVMFAK